MTTLRRQTVFASLDQPEAWPATRGRPQPQRLEAECCCELACHHLPHLSPGTLRNRRGQRVSDPFRRAPKNPSVGIGVETEENGGVDQDRASPPGLSAPDSLASVDQQGVGELILEADRRPYPGGPTWILNADHITARRAQRRFEDVE